MKTLFLILFLISINSFAENLSQSFPAGKGATYKILMKKDPTPIILSLYVAGTRVDSVHIEYFMETKGAIPFQLWQQFEIGVKDNSSAEIRKGFIYSPGFLKPEIIPANYLKGAQGGIQVNDFLFSSKAQLDKHKVGVETVEISAGTTKATHYRSTNNGQTVDYWISDDAKPMGLVMLVSRSEKNENQNYSLELTSMIENVKSKIIPEEAIPLTEKGKQYLAKPESIK